MGSNMNPTKLQAPTPRGLGVKGILKIDLSAEWMC